MQKMLAFVVAFGLFGCASDEEMRRQYVADVNAQCRAYGFKPGTPEFSNCLMQIDVDRQRSAEMQRQQAIGQGAVMMNSCNTRDARGRPLCP